MRNIKMKKDDAVKFFGTQSKIANLLNMDQSLISRQGYYLSDGVAFALLWISKTPKYRHQRPKLAVEVLL
jgi:hypothetical protein